MTHRLADFDLGVNNWPSPLDLVPWSSARRRGQELRIRNVLAEPQPKANLPMAGEAAGNLLLNSAIAPPAHALHGLLCAGHDVVEGIRQKMLAGVFA